MSNARCAQDTHHPNCATQGEDIPPRRSTSVMKRHCCSPGLLCWSYADNSSYSAALRPVRSLLIDGERPRACCPTSCSACHPSPEPMCPVRNRGMRKPRSIEGLAVQLSGLNVLVARRNVVGRIVKSFPGPKRITVLEKSDFRFHTPGFQDIPDRTQARSAHTRTKFLRHRHRPEFPMGRHHTRHPLVV